MKRKNSTAIHVYIKVCRGLLRYLPLSTPVTKIRETRFVNRGKYFHVVSRGDTFDKGNPKISSLSTLFIAVETRSPSIVVTNLFSLAGPESLEPDFVGAPYEFWVGANVPVGTSVGQIRLNDAVKTNDLLIYDLLHSYEEGGTYLRTINRATGCVNL